jgi:fermentation-respiration switch protein FrsA (DUF1100 family)
VKVSRYVGWPLIAVSGFGALYWAANRSIYYPFAYPQGFWELQKQAGAEDVWLRTDDGVKLHGWWASATNSKLATLFLHGNAGNVTHRIRHIRAVTAAGSSILVIDYRGYGKSEGRPSERGLYLDARAGWKYLIARGYPPERIVIHGESLGSAVAVELAAVNRCGGVVLDAPFTSAKDVARTVLPFLGPALIWSFDSTSRIRSVHSPILVIHGDQDEVIPFELGRKLFEMAPEPKALWRVEQAGHNDILEVAGPAYSDRLAAFYNSLNR